ncbi:ATP-binding protein [Streptomyces sp. NTH33]|uniref:ATP-binding protein n=1 Tax=Streptomyces sp. NTH33 TaxID=1735453 RepID=UPI0015E8D7D6|nr:ATP-binding protein [Streptomyces sp. NTH33]
MPPKDAGTSLLDAPPLRQVGNDVLPAFGMAMRSAPSSVEVARRVTQAWVRCYCRMPKDQVESILVVVSELCTNAVLHGRHPSFDLRCWMPTPSELRLEIRDGSPSAVPEPQHVGPESESGRGLLLVDLLVSELGGSWGFTSDGTCAWFRLGLGEER